MTLRGRPAGRLPAAFLRQVRPGSGSAPAPADPVATAAPLAWWRADDLAGADGQVVTTWPDRTGNGHQLAAHGSPHLARPTAGPAAVQASRAGSAWLAAPLAIAGAALTLAWVGRARAPTTADTPFAAASAAGGADNDAPSHFAFYADSAAADHLYRGPASALSFPRPAAGDLAATLLRFDGSSVRAIVSGGIADVSAASSGAFAVGSIDVGGRSYTGVGSDLDFVEVVAWDRAITDPEWAAILAGWRARYGLA